MPEIDTSIAAYATHEQAVRTIFELRNYGFDAENLSIVGRGPAPDAHTVGIYAAGDRSEARGAGGAIWGGLWGLLLSAAIFWVPGIGWIAATGPLVRLLIAIAESGAVVGGASVLGAALSNLSKSQEGVEMHERELKAGSYLVIAHGNAKLVAQARQIMEQNGVSVVDRHVPSSSFSPSALQLLVPADT